LGAFVRKAAVARRLLDISPAPFAARAARLSELIKTLKKAAHFGWQ
jgi:hypothetical protein